MDNNDKLKMTFTPNTIEHLGVRLYSTIPPVIAELIANSYDADAKKVTVYLNDSDTNGKEIIVEDNGHGMSFDDINTKFLRIGRNRRAGDEQTSPDGRLVIGKKGLGKLSFFGIADKIVVSTTKNSKRNTFELDWNKISNPENQDKAVDDYEPTIIEQDVDDTEKEKGTIITLKEIKRITDFNPQQLAISIAKFFIIDSVLDIFVKHNNEDPIRVTNEMKYDSLDVEFEWSVPTDLSDFDDTYAHKNDITGKIFTTEKPIQPSTNMRGITLFSRKKLVNLPEYFSDSASSHFFSYLTGWLEVDFVDTLGEEVIGTNRQSLDWNNPSIVELREYLQRLIRFLERKWRAERKAKQDRDVSDKTGIDVDKWVDTIPDEIKKDFAPLLDSFRKNVDFPERQEQVVAGVKNLHGLVPEYPLLHWRYLHDTLKTTIGECYKKGEYYTAVFEGMKKYINELQIKTGVTTIKDFPLLENIYAIEKDSSKESPKRYTVVEKYKKPDGNNFDDETKLNITKGHRNLVLAMWQAFRDPISHEVVEELRSSGLYTEKDCLDALSLLSHLFRRLDDIQAVATTTP
jgi:uncharacterized protein (TIGR02391 family)